MDVPTDEEEVQKRKCPVERSLIKGLVRQILLLTLRVEGSTDKGEETIITLLMYI